MRAKVEHLFRTVKQYFGYAKVRYHGLAKNTACLAILFPLTNFRAMRHQVLA